MPEKRVGFKLVVAALVILLSSAGRAAEVSWLMGRSSPTGWSIQPAEPNGFEVIRFTGPTRTYLNPSLAERAFGGQPTLQVDPVNRKVELRFESPASAYSGSFWNPVAGLRGSFGPLYQGSWQFFCTHAGAAFSLSIQIGGPGTGPTVVTYVNGAAAGNQSGSSWVHAFTNLQDALAGATMGCEIRVAQGVYRPDQGAGQRAGDIAAAFHLKSGVVLKGGYAGSYGPDPNARDPVAYETILSGDLRGDDGTLTHPYRMIGDPNRSDNSYHVVVATRVDSTAVLDGFTIMGGNAFGSPQPDKLSCGGGIYNDESSPTIRDCLIVGNAVRHYGAGIYSRSACTPTLIQCIVADNWSEWWGGGLFNDGSDLRLERCLITGNGAGYHGGAIRNNTNGELVLSNCVISGNVAIEPQWGRGGALYSFGAVARLDHCTLVGNWAPLGACLACDSLELAVTSDVRFNNCILWDAGEEIWNNDRSAVQAAYSNVQGGWPGTGNIATEPGLTDAGQWDAAGTPDDRYDDVWLEGDYRLLWDSPCVDAGDPYEVPAAGATDFAGGQRLSGKAVDIGAYELKNEPPVARAGPDVAGFSLAGGVGTVAVDGSRSSDPEGLPLSYRWYQGDQVISTDRRVTLELPLGEHTLTLIVSDGVNDSAPDEVRATVTTLIPAQTLVSPRELRRYGGSESVLTTTVLPPGTPHSAFDYAEPALLFPGGVKAVAQTAFTWLNGKTLVLARFNKAELMAAVPANGSVELRVVGRLNGGHFFSGTDTVRIR